MLKILALIPLVCLISCTKSTQKNTTQDSPPPPTEESPKAPEPAKPVPKTVLNIQSGPSGGESLLDLKSIGNISRGLSRSQLQRVIRAARPGLQACITRTRETGRIQVRVSVGNDGKVTGVELLKHKETPLEKCAKGVFARMIFPLFTGPSITFTYAFVAQLSSTREIQTEGGSTNNSSGGRIRRPKKPLRVNTGHKHDGQGSEDLQQR
ncbi:FMN-binding protein [Myxococcota bacterium]|nr:FMN-binding protein [Myxococcota bacterium]MBU1535768.1 FMN-binding protein [Myxococcota bacterium]